MPTTVHAYRLLRVLGFLAWSSALVASEPPADSPPAPAAQSPQPAQQAAAPDSTPKASETGLQNSPAESSATAPSAPQPAKTATAKVTDPITDKRLRAQGWKRKVMNGELVYCKEEEVLGTRFPKTVCGPPDMIKDVTQRSRDYTDQIEHNIGNPIKP